LMLLLLLSCGTTASPGSDGDDSFPCGAVYSPDGGMAEPVRPYRPQPGDIVLASDQRLWMRLGHWMAGSAGVQHSGILFQRSDGRLALLEAGAFTSTRVQALDPYPQFRGHVQAGDHVWIRQRRVPLTAEQSARLTAFAEAQEGKRLASLRIAAQLTPMRSRRLLGMTSLARPHGAVRRSYFCSELVVEACVVAGLLDAATARPAATLPRDLLRGTPPYPYLDGNPILDCDWEPACCWMDVGVLHLFRTG
jgi:hypothetical protein